MQTTFKKGKPYTLCLIDGEAHNDIYTFSVNVTFKYKNEDELYLFVDSETEYLVDLDTKSVYHTWYDLDEVTDFELYGDFDTHIDETEMISTYALANIVSGWLY